MSYNRLLYFFSTIESTTRGSSIFSKKSSFIFLLLLLGGLLQAQPYDMLLKGGYVIDPKNNIDKKMDVAITGKTIAKVAADIPETDARKVLQVEGLFVTPGFIDIHSHVFVGSNDGFADGFNSVSPDDFSFKSGVTTMVDAGTSGWTNFPLFKKHVIDRSRTRVLAFLEVADSGFSAGNAAARDLTKLNPKNISETIRKYPEHIVGICIGHYDGDDWTIFDKAREAANAVGVPILVECHLPKFSLEGQLNHMRPGDIITHAYEKVSERMPVVDENGKVRPFVLEARNRGVLFDVGHGGAGFWFSQAIPALRQGLLPNSFGTDFHRFSMNAGMKDMLNVMSKYLNMGMSLSDVITRATWYPARSIHREDLGNLSEGSVADIAVVGLTRGQFGFIDAGNNKIKGTRKFVAEMTIREGKIVWDLNGISATPYNADTR